MSRSPVPVHRHWQPTSARLSVDVSPVSREVEAELIVLLIEDDDIDAEHTSRILRRLPFIGEVVRARSMAEGLQLLDTRQPSLVLLDLGLPDASGQDAIRTLVDHDDTTAVVVLSGLGEDQAALAALEVGAEDYMEKERMTGASLERSIRHACTRKQAHERLRWATRRLERTDQDYDDFTHAVAHDLRAPVRTARLLADRLTARTRSGQDVSDLGQRLDSTLGRLDNVIMSMLDYAGLRTNAHGWDRVELSSLLHDVVDSLEADLVGSGGEVTIDVDQAALVRGDATLLWRVFNNLISNSIKYRRDEVPPRVNVSSSGSGQWVRVTLVDNGIGIPNADRERVFRVLQQLETGSPGQGLGLSICRQIVNSHDGSIWVDPSDTQGTTIKIDLPRGRS